MTNTLAKRVAKLGKQQKAEVEIFPDELNQSQNIVTINGMVYDDADTAINDLANLNF